MKMNLRNNHVIRRLINEKKIFLAQKLFRPAKFKFIGAKKMLDRQKNSSAVYHNKKGK